MTESRDSPAATLPAQETAMPEAGADESTAESLPSMSVIVPVRNDPLNLDLCLRALRASDTLDYEIIVVDDASTDRTPEVAPWHGVGSIRMDDHSGPAAARNRGAQCARHPYLVFIDADVCVHPDTLRKLAETFLHDPTIDAVFGSYDQNPGAPDVLSQYRNLMHHYVHQTSNEEASSFWSGCGAIKRSVFLELNGFDAGYDQASVEDIEFGLRLGNAGHRVVLAKSIQVKHMKRWTLWGMIKCDVLRRGIPWTLLVLREGKLPNDLNLKYSHRLSVVLAGCLLTTLLVGSWYYRSLLLLPLVVLVGVLLIDHWTTKKPVPRWARVLTVLTAVATVSVMGYYELIGHRLIQLWSLLALAIVSGIVLLNLRFYLFYARVRRPLLLLLIIPLHVLYYLYSGFAFAVGLVLHLWRRGTRRAPSPQPKGDAP